MTPRTPLTCPRARTSAVRAVLAGLVGALALLPVLAAPAHALPGPAPRLDPRDRDAVAEAYRTRFAPADQVDPGWTGSDALCLPGQTSPAAQSATQEALNFVRDLAGLDPVTVSPTASLTAQLAALLMRVNGRLDHHPDASWRCWSAAGADAAAGSLLAWDGTAMTPGLAVRQYLADPGDINTAAGHRRWLMHPGLRTIGNALTPSTSAIWVVDGVQPVRREPAFTSWPTAGWFPAPLEPRGRWSMSAGSARADLSRARVRVTSAGRRLPVSVHPVQQGLGRPTVVFEVAGVQPTGRYRVTVSGIRGDGERTRTWRVKLFTP